MLRYLKTVQDIELPAPVAVCGILLAAALTKEGHSAWAITAPLLVYVFTVTIQFCKRVENMRAQTVSANHR